MPRAGLTPQRVADTAARLVDREGLQALTLARLAGEMGVAPPSLYKHVGGLDDLTGRVAALAVDMLAQELTASVMGRSDSSALRALGQAYRRFAHDHPGLYPLAQHHAGSLAAGAQRTVEIVIAALRGYRIPPERLIDAVRMTRAALHGFVDIEIAGGFARPEPVEESFAALLEMLDDALRRLGSG